jgi:GNAT superfamily N-acetyltransferase
MDDLVFRKATPADLPFLITAVKAAEKLSVAGCTYEKLFLLSVAEVDALLNQALSMESGGYQLALSTFFIHARGSVPVACCSSWIEAADGVSSGFKMAAVLSDLLGFEKWIDAKAAIKAFAEATPRRTAGTLQMETFYVDPSSRGQGLAARIIDSVIRSFDSVVMSAKIAEITMLEGNAEALRAYQKAGFHIHRKGAPGNALFQTLTGSAGFIQLHKTIGA